MTLVTRRIRHRDLSSAICLIASLGIVDRIKYVNPTAATIRQHMQDATFQALYTHGVLVLVGDVVLYESSVSELNSAMASYGYHHYTTEIGDITINHHPALISSSASISRGFLLERCYRKRAI